MVVETRYRPFLSRFMPDRQMTGVGRKLPVRYRESGKEKQTLLMVGRPPLPSNEEYPVLRLADGTVPVRPKYED